MGCVWMCSWKMVSHNKYINLPYTIAFLMESTVLFSNYILSHKFSTDMQQDDGTRKENKSCKRDEITNKVFEGILQEKANAVSFIPTKSDKESVKVRI